MVQEIIDSPDRGDVLADRFGVAKSTISQIRSGAAWAHVKRRSQPRDRRATLRRFFNGEVPTKEAEAIAEKYKAGANQDNIALEFGVTKPTITRTLKALGVSIRGPGLKKRPVEIDGGQYEGVLEAMRVTGRSHAYIMKNGCFLEAA